MNIVCVICSDRLTPSDDVFYTPCGHVFHFVCLTQWLERSHTCPQCRERVTQTKIHRIYFNYSNNDTIAEDPTSLQATIDNLKFQLLIKEQEAKKISSKHDTMKKQATGLRAEVLKLEKQLTDKNTAISALKEQTRFFKSQYAEVENAKIEVTRLQKKLEDCRNIQMIINAPNEEVDEIISDMRDPKKLLTYISIMKRELTTSVNRRKELRTSLKQVQMELTNVSMERNFLLGEHEKRKKLEKTLAECESRLKESERRHSNSGSINVNTRKDDYEERLKFVSGENNDIEAGVACSLNNTSDVIDLTEDSFYNKKTRSLKKNDVIVISPTSEGNEENYFCSKPNYVLGADLAQKKRHLITATATQSFVGKRPRLAHTLSTVTCADLKACTSSNLGDDDFGDISKKSHKVLKKPCRGTPKQLNLDDGNNIKLQKFINSNYI